MSESKQRIRGADSGGPGKVFARSTWVVKASQQASKGDVNKTKKLEKHGQKMILMRKI